MIFRDRPDGKRIKVPSFQALLPYLFRSRTESTLFIKQRLDLSNTLAYLDKKNRGLPKGEKRHTFFHICLAAAARTVAQRPKLNTFTSGFHYYQRNQIVFSFVAKKQMADHGEEINLKVAFQPQDSLADVSQRILGIVNKEKRSDKNSNTADTDFYAKFPRPILKMIMAAFRFLDYFNLAPWGMIKADPMYSTMFAANLGSVGIDAPYHHLFQWGNSSFFMAIGKIKKGQYIHEQTGESKICDVVDMSYTMDDRICDGIYAARSIDMIKHYIENPMELEQPLELNSDELAVLNLIGAKDE